jgi:uncharacterized protein (DUF58 family)
MSLRFRILYFFYHRSAAVQHWFGRRIRPAGAGAMLVVSLGSFMSLGQPKNSIFQIFCFSLAMVLLSLGWVIFRRAKLAAVLELPLHATAGEPLRYSIRLKNTGSRTLRGAKLEQTTPDPRPGLREFASLSEPGEEERNIFDRTMLYYRWQWLMARKDSFHAAESDETLELAAGEHRKIGMMLTPAHRGVVAMGDVRALLPDPLGFFQRCKRIDTKPARLVVLPKRYRLPQIIMPGSAAFRIGGEVTSNAIGNAGEFVGLREYRSGDPMRQIHWKSWAHTGRPMVKELEDNFFPRYALVLDTFAGSPDESLFEEMVSVAASFIVGLDYSESLLDLMFIASEEHTVTAGRGMERAEKLLEVLADVTIEDSGHLDLLASTVIRHRENMTSCLLILNGWDSLRAEFVGNLIKAAIPCVPLIVGNGPPPPGVIGHWLENGEIARDLLRLPTRLSAAI